ncbi:MAG: type II toxin-antitoxin system RelE/ParE family toxin [Fimbriiglobus sp.]
MKSLVLHPDAAAEHAEDVAWYEARQRGLGKRFRAAVVAALRAARRRPKGHGQEPGTDCRRVLVDDFPYKVVYLEDDNRISVLAIPHTAREPGYWHHRLTDG